MTELERKREGSDERFTFREAEQIFAEEEPAIVQNARIAHPERAAAQREYVYHYAAARFADEGVLESDPDCPSSYSVVVRTLPEWHGVWVNAIGDLLQSR